MAESGQRLSERIKKTNVHNPGKGIAGFRDILVHAYPGFDLDVVWGVVERDLPTLELGLNKISRD
jgi:uncharacterized protein with HEPN domain